MSPLDRPSVSVCMAAYNGSRYVEQQLCSVLRQLGPHDEVVIVEDASRDTTKDVIRALADPRIRLIEHAVNQGVVASFEEALRAARGEILFLCDDDDLWAEDKVARFLAAFGAHPEAMIVTSRVSFIDDEGRPTESDLYRNRKHFAGGFWQNVLRNHFQGSAMALRASVLPGVLPFPRGVGFLHDQWIGTRNALRGGQVVYIDEPLLWYRRHPLNFSRRTSRLKQIRTRGELLLAHARRSFEESRRGKLK